VPDEIIQAKYNPFHKKSLARTEPGAVWPQATGEEEIHWISANVQMERF